MWAAIKARLSGRRTAPTSNGTSTNPTSISDGSPKDPLFTEGILGSRIEEAKLDDILDDLEVGLLQSDVALPVVDRLRKDLKKELAGRKLRWGADVEEAVRITLKHSVRTILERPVPDLIAAVRAKTPRPYIVLFVGVNGTGKTTTVAKIAGWLRDQQLGVVIAAGDTFRAGAIEQLLVHGERLGIRVVRQQEGSDPAAVAFDAVAHARSKSIDVVLVDTAGRQHTNENLVEEAKKIRRVVHPDLTLFVGDALSGNDVPEQARLFTDSLGVDGLVLTKLDADVKGGAALSVSYVTGKPIYFVGVGQGYGDLRRFEPEWMLHRLFDEGGAS
ncbi:MAG: signal recognition particle-docking protein FtsY [Thermoplasmata archaeon]|nr:signal recognition particle-docking protein FtsY [Thermoplasmata archaeon]